MERVGSDTHADELSETREKLYQAYSCNAALRSRIMELETALRRAGEQGVARGNGSVVDLYPAGLTIHATEGETLPLSKRTIVGLYLLGFVGTFVCVVALMPRA